MSNETKLSRADYEKRARRCLSSASSAFGILETTDLTLVSVENAVNLANQWHLMHKNSERNYLVLASESNQIFFRRPRSGRACRLSGGILEFL